MSRVPGVEGLRGRVGAGEPIDCSKDTVGAAVDAPSECADEDNDPELPSEAEWYTMEGVLGVAVGAAQLVCPVSGVGEFTGVVIVVVLAESATSRDKSVAVGDGKGGGAPGVPAMLASFVVGRVDSERRGWSGDGAEEKKRGSKSNLYPLC